MSGKDHSENSQTWDERRLVARSLSFAKSEEKSLRERLNRAQNEIKSLNERKQGKPVLRSLQQAQEAARCVAEAQRVSKYLRIEVKHEAQERTKPAHAGYDLLLDLVGEIQRNGMRVPEVITSGTPTLPCSLAYQGFKGKEFIHRVSPGTIVYGDATSLVQLPEEYGLRPAVLVVTRVISRPRLGVVTCDAGHKAVSADAGVPTCVVVGHPELTPLPPSEEHLPMAVAEEAAGPKIGDALYLLPRHVCPTVNNFDCALLARDGQIESIEKVSARGREAPLLQTLHHTACASGQAVAEEV